MNKFSDDLNFLNKYYDLLILTGENDQSQILVCPQLQSKVMTSTADGLEGKSLGYINYDLISSEKIDPLINPVGGEDRFWIGPEGGQFSVFFKSGAPFTIENAYTPAALDREPFDVVSKEKSKATFRKELELVNYSGNKFSVLVDRTIQIINKAVTEDYLGMEIPEQVKMVAFESINKMTNRGTEAWTKKTGLLSIWILGMFPPSDNTVVVCPFKEILGESIVPIINDDYFGKVSDDRLIINGDVILFKGDGKYRSKIGLSPLRAKSVMGSYDPDNGVLTIVQFSMPAKKSDYVNSMWELQENPYAGDVTNSYNDGPKNKIENEYSGFYELESSSPAVALSGGDGLSHTHRTFHFMGEEKHLNKISNFLLGIHLETIKDAFLVHKF